MLSALAIASVLVATVPDPALVANAPEAQQSPGLPIKGVTVDKKMPQGVTHIEAPPLRGYKIQLAPTPPATPSPTPEPKRR
ncbi:hypothetical protein J7643_07430 [bacterium]|nr:hypothetical protein [bacterium]